MNLKDRTERIKSIVIATLASSALLLAAGCDNPTVSEAQAPTGEPTGSAAEQMADEPSAQDEPMVPSGEMQAREVQEKPAAPEPGAGAPGTVEPEAAPGGAAGANQAGQQAKPGAGTPPPGAAKAGGEVSDKKLEAFIEIAPKVQRMEKTYREKMSEAETAEEAGKIREDAYAEIGKAFDETPLGPEEFSAIATRMSTDPELQARAQAIAGE